MNFWKPRTLLKIGPGGWAAIIWTLATALPFISRAEDAPASGQAEPPPKRKITYGAPVQLHQTPEFLRPKGNAQDQGNRSNDRSTARDRIMEAAPSDPRIPIRIPEVEPNPDLENEKPPNWIVPADFRGEDEYDSLSEAVYDMLSDRRFEDDQEKIELSDLSQMANQAFQLKMEDRVRLEVEEDTVEDPFAREDPTKREQEKLDAQEEEENEATEALRARREAIRQASTMNTGASGSGTDSPSPGGGDLNNISLADPANNPGRNSGSISGGVVENNATGLLAATRPGTGRLTVDRPGFQSTPEPPARSPLFDTPAATSALQQNSLAELLKPRVAASEGGVPDAWRRTVLDAPEISSPGANALRDGGAGGLRPNLFGGQNSGFGVEAAPESNFGRITPLQNRFLRPEANGGLLENNRFAPIAPRNSGLIQPQAPLRNESGFRFNQGNGLNLNQGAGNPFP